MNKKLLVTIVSAVLLLILLTHMVLNKWSKNQPVTDLKEIKANGSLVIATSNNPLDYFQYKGEPIGFQLELLEDFASSLGLKVDVIVCNNPTETIELLRSGKCDIIASSWNVSMKNDGQLLNSLPLMQTDLMLVQRDPSVENSSKPLVSGVNELIGKTVYVPLLSSQAGLLRGVTNTRHEQIKVVEMAQYSPEKLTELVAKGKLDYTVCSNVLTGALKNQYPSLDFNTVVEKSEPIVWSVRKSSPLLLSEINKWLVSFKKSTRYLTLVDKYFSSEKKWASTETHYYSRKGNTISAYDDLIKKYSAQIKWDWRLLASLIYQESRFVPGVKSRKGAYGLMQLMPTTLQHFGAGKKSSPEQQIKAGVKYIKSLDQAFARLIFDPKERINFILASYNIGPGHIFDAQKLAPKMGKNPKKWFNNVDTCLLSKSDPENYNDPLVKFGYCKGVETFSFVQEVMDRYRQYKKITKE
ncbi:MAG: transporter substrate-binding domain-containing protein [Bacteroidota bacterium]|nr:transporter substrate-binding domain-containing protein [Bacteroidota bacterium]